MKTGLVASSGRGRSNYYPITLNTMPLKLIEVKRIPLGKRTRKVRSRSTILELRPEVPNTRQKERRMLKRRSTVVQFDPPVRFLRFERLIVKRHRAALR